MKGKKVLIITYYWPPAGGPGVQRWLKFAKYLPEFGYSPIVYTPENPSYPITDISLADEISEDLEVIRTKIWEPYQIAERLNPKNKKYKLGQFEEAKQQSFLSKLSVFIRGNFFIPDARVAWVKPSIRFLREYISENNIELIVTTGPPHSMHLIGLGLKRELNNLKWIADFRDPWTQISYHSQLKLTKRSAQKHLTLEKKVIQSADVVLATSFADGDSFNKSGATRVEVITNGYEEIDVLTSEQEKKEKFKITYSGGLEWARNPKIVWQALAELFTDNNFRQFTELHFYGNISNEVEQSIYDSGVPKEVLFKHGYVSHQKALDGMREASLLLLTNFDNPRSKGIIPGKLFEYLATQIPILALGPKQADVEIILKQTTAGKYFLHSDKIAVKAYIKDCFYSWQKRDAESENNNLSYQQYSRKNLTQKLSEVFKL